MGEAIRIKRRGEAGAILNSKSEYNRCYIPQLQLEDIREEQKREEEQSKEEEELQNILEENFAGLEQARESTREQLDRDKRRKLGKLGSLRKQEKRQKEDDNIRERRKKLKYEVLGANSGEETLTIALWCRSLSTPPPNGRTRSYNYWSRRAYSIVL